MNIETNWLEALKKDLQSEEGRKFAKEYFSKIINKENKEKEQLDRFHTKIANESKPVSFYIQKVLNYYNSNKYKNKWFSKGIEPPQSLYFFLYEYAIQYGKLVEDKTNLSNLFSTDLYYLDGYYFTMMVGQGSYVKIIKE